MINKLPASMTPTEIQNTVDFIQRFWDKRTATRDVIERLKEKARAVTHCIQSFKHIADCVEKLKSAPTDGCREYLIVERNYTRKAMKNESLPALRTEHKRIKNKIATLQRKLDILPVKYPRIEALTDERRLTHNSIARHHAYDDDFTRGQEQRIRDIEVQLAAAIEAMDKSDTL